jgi:hypothetical protein
MGQITTRTEHSCPENGRYQGIWGGKEAERICWGNDGVKKSAMHLKCD